MLYEIIVSDSIYELQRNGQWHEVICMSEIDFNERINE